jgi:hypothetical protein
MENEPRLETREDGQWLIIGENELPVERVNGKLRLVDAPYGLIDEMGMEAAYATVCAELESFGCRMRFVKIRGLSRGKNKFVFRCFFC